VGEGIEGLVHISEMSEAHVDLPEQVVTPGEELWVKIIDLDLQRRRISLSIKQAAEGGVVAAEYQQHFGEHAYDESGNYVGAADVVDAEQAWAEYYAEYGDGSEAPEEAGSEESAEGEVSSAEAGEGQTGEGQTGEGETDEAPAGGTEANEETGEGSTES
jgi:small subunit ribosomal protein S1